MLGLIKKSKYGTIFAVSLNGDHNKVDCNIRLTLMHLNVPLATTPLQTNVSAFSKDIFHKQSISKGKVVICYAKLLTAHCGFI